MRTGYLPDYVVPLLLWEAAAVAYPALEEGFGLHTLQAIRLGLDALYVLGVLPWQEMAGQAASLIPATRARSGPRSARRSRKVVPLPRRSLELIVAAERTWEASVALHLRAYAVARAASQ